MKAEKIFATKFAVKNTMELRVKNRKNRKG